MKSNFIHKSLIFSALLASASCQSQVDANSNDFSQEIRNIAQKSPPLHRVEWKVQNNSQFAIRNSQLRT